MISRYEVTLNGVKLNDLHSKILVLDVNYAEPNREFGTFSPAKRDGGRMYRKYKEKASVTVSFAIREYAIAERQRICQLIGTWAMNGGELMINDRTNQKLVCECERKPAISSARDWTATLTITFTAYAVPYWQDTVPATLTLSGTSKSGTLYVPGSAPETVTEVTITAGAALSSISLTVAGKTMTLSGLSVASGGVITISYDSQMIQSIKTGSTSLLNKRTGADDLLAKCGANNSMSFSASASCTVVFKARGLWD